tara:strand:- start:13791 stop:14753 length:963 start_codon:yes stop_codon:yes gene_type:complete
LTAEVPASLTGYWPALNDYEIVRQLAAHRGVSSYLALRPSGLGVERQVLLKVCQATLQFGFSSAKELSDESRLGLRLDHPGLLSVIDYGRDEGCTFQVREWVDGISLRRLLEQTWAKGQFPIIAALQLGEQLCSVLCYLHQLSVPPWAPAGLIHHGVVPSNVIVSAQGEARLGNLFQVQPRGTQLTSYQGASEDPEFGTARAFIAPELQAGAGSEPATDIFALGTLLYEAVVGPEALSGDVSSDWQRQRDDREVLRRLEAAPLPPRLTELLIRSMASSPNERFNSAEEMRLELIALLDEQQDQAGVGELRRLVQLQLQAE